MEKEIQAFTNCFIKDWKNLTEEEYNILSNRRYTLNKNFAFTKEAIEKLRKLNKLLQKEENRIKKSYSILYHAQKKLLMDGIIDDYNLELELHCFNDSYYPNWHKDFEGSAFYSDYILMLSYFDPENDDDNKNWGSENWNEFEFDTNHPLCKDFHCHTFHHLYDHTSLAWEDILRIEEIWIEIKVTNQFFIETVN